MNKKVLKTLEYHKIIDRLAEHATSDPGRRLCRELVPMTELSDIESAQQETADALTRLFKKGSISFGSTRELGMSLKSLEIGSTLSIPELLHIASLLENTARVKNYGRKDREDIPDDSLTPLFSALEPLTQLSHEIYRCILSEEEISDDASPGLKHVRRSMAVTTERIHSQLNSMVNGSLHSYLQDALITTRNGRYCLPVKAEYRSQVPGMIHDQSSTGSTIFIEPAAVVNLNNQMRELELKEKEEIEKVLASLSALAGEHTVEIAENQHVMTRLDFIFAKASLALEQNATKPLFNEDHIINIRGARHPLLDKKKTVPIDIRLGKDYDLLIITGPNTGGKTVSLKTTGLFCLMGQAGLHIPAQDRSELSIFREVYADIGDEQSIEQSLSTFSSHMTSIVSILKDADADSLCLFDELGAGTDPTEGAALAIAILNHLHDRGIRTMATTHYSELKVYALSTSFVENACCEFDVESLRPTYRLLIGVPGKSNAFAITQRLGMDTAIVDRARELVSREGNAFEQVVGRLEEDRRKMEDELEALRASAAQAKANAEASQRLKDEAEAQAKKEIDRARQEAAQIVQKTRQRADALVGELEELRRQKNKQLSAEQKARLRSGLKELESSSDPVHQRRDDNYVLPRPLVVGDEVLLYDIDKEATVLELPKDGTVLVQAGIIKTRVPLGNVRLLSKRQLKKKNPTRTVTKNVSTPETSSSLDLRGQTVEEALMEVDNFLDRASRMHLSQVTIIHGKGTGALRTAVQQHLRRCSQVKSFRLGTYGEGESGVTIAELK